MTPRHFNFLNRSFRSISLRYQPSKEKLDRMITIFQHKLLNIAIDDINISLKQAHKKIENMEKRIHELIPDQTFDDFLLSTANRINHTFSSNNIKYVKKLNELLACNNNKIATWGGRLGWHIFNTSQVKQNVNPKWINNLSSVPLPSEIESILALGQNFGLRLTNRKFPGESFITEIETKIFHVEKSKQDELRGKLVNTIQNYQSMLTNTKPERSLKTLISFLKEHKEIMVTRADKGNTTVVLDKEK